MTCSTNYSLAPNGKSSALFQDILDWTKNLELAIRLYGRVNTKDFNNWYGDTVRDINGDPITSFDYANDLLIVKNNKGQVKSLLNNGDFGKQYIKNDIEQTLIKNNILHKYSNKLRITKGVEKDIFRKNKSYIDSENAYFIKNYGQPLYQTKDDKNSIIVTLNDYIIGKMNERNNSSIYYGEIVDNPTIQDTVIPDKGYFDLNTKEIEYANSLITRTVTFLLEKDQLKIKDIKSGVTVKKEIIKFINQLAETRYNANQITKQQFEVNKRITKEIENNDIFWNLVRTYISNSIGYTIIDIPEDSIDLTTANWDDNSQFKEEPNDRISKEIKFLIASTHKIEAETVGGLPLMLDVATTFKDLVHKLWDSTSVNNMMEKLLSYSNIVNPSLKSFYDKISKDESLKNMLFTNVKYARPDVNILDLSNINKPETRTLSNEARIEYQLSTGWVNNINTRINLGIFKDTKLISKFKELQSKLEDKDTKYIDKYDIISELLGLFNIDIKPYYLRHYIENIYTTNKVYKNVTDIDVVNNEKLKEALVTKTTGGIIGRLESYLGTETEFDDFKNILSLAKGVSIFYQPENSSFSNIEGNLESSFIKPSYITDWAEMFNSSEGLTYLSNLVNTPDIKYSNWLIGKLITVKGTKNKNGVIKEIDNNNIKLTDERLSISRFGGVILPNGVVRSYTDITPDEWKQVKYKYFLNGEYFIPSPSDKGHTYTIKGFVIGKDQDLTVDDSFKITDKNHILLTSLRNAFYQEVHRIDAAVRLVFDETYKVKDEWLENQDRLIVGYHYILEKGKPVFLKDGKPAGSAFKFHQFDISVGNNSISGNNVFKNNFIVKELLTEENTIRINKFIDIFSSFIIKNEYDSYVDIQTKEEVALFAINNWIANMEMQNFLLGNIAFYGKGVTLNKRAMEILSPGIVNSSIGTNETFNGVTINDRIVKAKIYNNIKLALEVSNTNKNVINRILKSYSNINSGDGLSYITLEEYEKRLIKSGLYNRYKSLLDKLKDNNSTIQAEDLDQFIQSQKNFYYEYKYNEELNMFVPLQVKNSEFVLIPRFLDENSQLKALHDAMVKNNINQVNFESAVKVGASYIAQVVDSKGNLITDKLDSEFTNGLQKFTYKNLRKQSDTVNHIVDEENKFNIKLNKKILDNVTDEKVKLLVDNLVSGNIKDSFKLLAYELGTIQGNSIIYDEDKLAEILANEYLQRSTSINEIIAVLKDINSGVFNIPLDSNLIRHKNQSLLLSLFDNNVTRQVFPGIHGPQVSNAFMKEVIKQTGKTKIKDLPTPNVTNNYKELKFTQYKDNNGKLIYERCQILIPYWAKAFIANNSNITLEDLQKAGLDKMLGYRQPTEDKHSVILFEVVGILDSSQGSSIVVPDEFVTQTGSDFDIDTIYTMNFHFTYRKGVLEKVKYLDKEEDSRERYDKYIDYIISKTRKENDVESLITNFFNTLNFDVSSSVRESVYLSFKGGYSEGLSNKEVLSKVYNDIDGIIEVTNTNIEEATSDALKNRYTKDLQQLDLIKLSLSNVLKENESVANSIITYEDFQLLPIEEQNYKPARDNKLLEIYEDILTNIEHYEENVTPNGFDEITEAKEFVESIYNPFDTNNNFNLSSTQDNFRVAAMSGRNLKALSVNGDSFISFAQKLGLQLVKSINIKYADKKDNDAAKSKHEVENGNIKLKTIGKVNGNNREQFKNIHGYLITSYVAQATANILDNVKYPLPFLNEFNISVWRLLPELGSTWKLSTLLVNQPIIQYYIGQKQRKNDGFFKGKINPLTSSYNRVLKQLIDLYKSEGKDLTNLLTKEELNSKKLYFNTDRIQELLSNLKYNKDLLDESVLIYNLKNYNNTTEQKLLNDLSILNQYVELEKIADERNEIILYISQDRKGLTNNFNTTNNFVKYYKKHLNKDVDNLIETKDSEDYVLEIYTKEEKDSKDKILLNFNKFSNMASYKTFSNDFISETKPVKNFIDGYSSVRNSIYNIKDSIKEDIISYINAFTVRNLPFFVNTNWTNLLGIGSEYKNLDISDNNNLKEYSNLSLVNKLILVKDKFKDNIDNTHLLNKLLPVVNNNYINKIGYSGVIFNIDKNVNSYINDFHDLWYNSNPYLHLLAQDLIRYAYFNDGLNFGKNLAKVIPVEILSREPIVLDTVNNIDILDGIGYSSEYYKQKNQHNNPDFTNPYNDIFKINFARSKWTNNNIVPYVETEYIDKQQGIRRPGTVNWRPNKDGIIVLSSDDFNKLDSVIKSAPVVKQELTVGKDTDIKLFAKYVNYVSDQEGNVTATYYYLPVGKLNRYEFTDRSIVAKNNNVLPLDYYLRKFIQKDNSYIFVESVRDIWFRKSIESQSNNWYSTKQDYSNIKIVDSNYLIKEDADKIRIYNSAGMQVFTNVDENNIPVSQLGKRIYVNYMYKKLYGETLTDKSYITNGNSKYVVLPVAINEIYAFDINHKYETYFTNKQLIIDLINNNNIETTKSVSKIYFKEEESYGYRERTIKNASADITLAFAVDFNSAGEKLTKKSVLEQNKLYIPINANNFNIVDTRINQIIDSINNIDKSEISLNIAGNGIYTMSNKYSQSEVDTFTFNFLNSILSNPRLNKTIKYIRTGGQTGFDEAGAKAGEKLNIPTYVLAPKGWKFRNENGIDISNEKEFKDRFDINNKITNNINNINEASSLREVYNELLYQLNKKKC